MALQKSFVNYRRELRFKIIRFTFIEALIDPSCLKEIAEDGTTIDYFDEENEVQNTIFFIIGFFNIYILKTLCLY
jgi:hypothetical protein